LRRTDFKSNDFMLRKKINETLIAMKQNKAAMQAEYEEMMIYIGNLKKKREKNIEIKMISACIAYAELLLKTGREQQP